MASSPVLHDLLEPPRYGWEREGRLYKPTARELWSEFFHRMDVFRDRKNWLPFTSWFWTGCLVPFAVLFLIRYPSLPTTVLPLLSSILWLATPPPLRLPPHSPHHPS